MLFIWSISVADNVVGYLDFQIFNILEIPETNKLFDLTTSISQVRGQVAQKKGEKYGKSCFHITEIVKFPTLNILAFKNVVGSNGSQT